MKGKTWLAVAMCTSANTKRSCSYRRFGKPDGVPLVMLAAQLHGTPRY